MYKVLPFLIVSKGYKLLERQWIMVIISLIISQFFSQTFIMTWCLQVLHLCALKAVLETLSPDKDRSFTELREWVQIVHRCKNSVESLLGCVTDDDPEIIFELRYSCGIAVQWQISKQQFLACWFFLTQEHLAEDSGCCLVYWAYSYQITWVRSQYLENTPAIFWRKYSDNKVSTL